MTYVKRWVLRDPYDSNPSTNSYTFPRNPAEMSSINPARPVTAMPTTAGKMLLWEGATPAQTFTFTGPILEKTHYDALLNWTYTKKRRVTITDHYGRVITCVLTSVEMVPKRRNNYYYSHDYTVTALIISVAAATVPNSGPTP